ncbi:MAG: tetratricopeptide repeat protein [Acidobacteria bacterium]|jgi:CHAT domain-containing protein/Tfp pilus assembly protein PilF|nr:tetratricopeptide repeat protein [Acidobacteriota bacterium]
MQIKSLKTIYQAALSITLLFATSNLFTVFAITAQRPIDGEKIRQADNGNESRRQQEDAELTLGKPIERQLAGNEAHSYKIALAANQYLHVVVEQRGIDVVVALFAPDGKKIAEVDSPNGTQGEEPISIVAEAAGSYRLEVRSPEAKVAAGRYQVKVEELRTANLQDKNQFAAQQAYAEGKQLESEGSAGSLRKALDKYQEALPLWHAVNDRAKEADTLNNIGVVYVSLGEKQKALDYLNQALPLSRAVGDREGEASTLSNIGYVYHSLGENKKALDYYNQALPLRRAVGDRSGEASTLTNIGGVYDSLGEKQKALDYYNQALPFNREIGDRRGEAITLNNIGTVYNFQGENQKALDYYNQALLLLRAVSDRYSEANMLHNIGVVYDSLGEKQKALDYYNQALPLRRLVGDKSGEAMTLTGIGVVYASLDEPQKALDYLNQTLPVFRAVGNRRGEAHTFHNIGRVYADLGEKQKALDYYNQALPLRRAVGDRGGEAATLTNIGRVYADLGEKQKALDYYNQALPLRRAVGDRYGEAATLRNIGYVYAILGEKQKALDYYNQALPFSRAVGDRSGEASTLAAIARVDRDRSNLVEARARIEEALTIVESLRTKIAGQELRSSYFATVQQYYDFYINLLMRLHQQQPSAGLDGAALQASERGRARSLLETLAEANADIRQGVDPTLLARERSIQQLLAGKSERLSRISDDERFKAQKSVARKEVDELLAQHQEVKAQIRVKSPRYAALTQPVPSNLAEIQQLLDKDTVLLEYALGEERSYLWLVTPQSLKSYELPKRSQIEETANRVITGITGQNNVPPANNIEYQKQQAYIKQAKADYPQTSAELGKILLGQIAPEIEGKRLLIVSDGALQYVPFAALPKPVKANGIASVGEPLVASNEIVSLPSASTLAILRREEVARRDRKPYAKTVAVFADPVFDDQDARVSAVGKNSPPESKNGATRGQAQKTNSNPPSEDLQSTLLRSVKEVGLTNRGGLRRLVESKNEAAAIRDAAASGQATITLGFDASRERVMASNLAEYRIVHFATHGLLNEENPELSGVVLSLVDEQGKEQNGFLRLHEIFNLNLPVEMVVLSACQTGLGKKIKGEGLVGLTRGFMYAGAPRVVASLWSVDDRATALLMSVFYRKMLREKLSPAAALRAAQNEIRGQKLWRSPEYWAGFVLQGEWRNVAPNKK